jgi:hypothetical protein
MSDFHSAFLASLVRTASAVDENLAKLAPETAKLYARHRAVLAELIEREMKKEPHNV